MPDRQPVYVECRKCGERWKAITLRLPMPAEEFVRRLNGIGACPNCGAGAAEVIMAKAGEPAAGAAEVTA